MSSWSVREVTCHCVKDRLGQDRLRESEEAPGQGGGREGGEDGSHERAGHKRLRGGSSRTL